MANNDLLAEDNVCSTDINIEEKDEQGGNYRNNMRKTNREKRKRAKKIEREDQLKTSRKRKTRERENNGRIEKKEDSQGRQKSDEGKAV